MPDTDPLVTWTHDALDRLFDLAFLRHHAHAACVAGRFTDERDVQGALLQTIRQLKPPLNVPAHSAAWRIYNTLNLRYVQGLSQSEAAAQLNIGSRQMRREQQRAVQAVAVLLFERPAADGQRTGDAEPEFDQAAAGARPEFAHLDDLLRSTLRLFDALLERQRVHLTITAPSSMPAVRANAMVLRQLLVSGFNWLIGGVSDAEVQIEASIEPRQIAIRMAKVSHAASDPDLARTPVNQATDPSADALHTVRQLAGLLRAPVELSRAPGWISLTIRVPTDDAQCVLMIDDNPHAIQLVQRYLQQTADFYVLAVTDPSEALRQAVSARPACILLDVMMPERDGWELLTTFRAHPDTAGIPIIVSSVLREGNLAQALGATAMLVKPFTAAQLISLLRSVTAGRT